MCEIRNIEAKDVRRVAEIHASTESAYRLCSWQGGSTVQRQNITIYL